MHRYKVAVRPVIAALLILITCLSHARLNQVYKPIFPSFRQLMVLDDKASLQDILLITGGFRSVAADLAYIQLLQYIGGATILDVVDLSRDYQLLKPLTLRVTRIDPYFVQATIFGAGLLGWLRNINRPLEAIELLKEGIFYNPAYWPFHSYLIGIGYQKSDQIDKMVEALGSTINRSDCPVLVKIILANTFKLNKKYTEALQIWEGILSNTSETSNENRALQQIEEIKNLIAQSSSRPRN